MTRWQGGSAVGGWGGEESSCCFIIVWILNTLSQDPLPHPQQGVMAAVAVEEGQMYYYNIRAAGLADRDEAGSLPHLRSHMQARWQRQSLGLETWAVRPSAASAPPPTLHTITSEPRYFKKKCFKNFLEEPKRKKKEMLRNSKHFLPTPAERNPRPKTAIR